MEKHTERICRESQCLVFVASSLLPPELCYQVRTNSICVNPRLRAKVSLMRIPVRVPCALEMQQAPASPGASCGTLGGSQLPPFFFERSHSN